MARQTPDLETAASRAHTLVRCYDSEAPVEYEQRVVAFLDVLGWGSAVSNSETDSELRRCLLNAAWALAAHVQNYVESDTVEHPSRDEYSQFSDSLVVSFPYEAPNDLLRLVRLVSEFQTTLLLSGFLLRGGVTVGSLFHSREIVFGPAMNRAYALEHEVAVHPRVVIDPALDAPLRAAKALLPPHWPFIVRSGDGPYETDFLTIFSRSPP